MPLDFVPKDHKEVLRAWIEAVCTKESLSNSALLLEMRHWLKQQKWPDADILKDSSLKRFRKSENGTAGSRIGKQLHGMWLFLKSQDRYKHHRPVAHADPVPSAASPDKLLAFALTNFFRERNDIAHRYTVERLSKMLAGRFVLYRQDLEPAVWGLEPRKTIRASAVEVAAADGYLTVSETQNFPKTRDRAAHHQLNTGVLFPYGDYVIGIIGEDKIVSFKTMVIEDIFSGPEADAVPTDYFRGKLLVASVRGSFPSVRFFCKRSQGDDQHGLYPYRKIDKDVLAYITRPTFDKQYEAVS
jgi:hypothetical protein